jgi:DegV family protein with EDD domain
VNKVAIITDTDCSLPDEQIARYGIVQVPITVHFGEETFTTGVDINDRTLFEKVDRLKRLPTTSAPSPGAFASAFEAAFTRGAEALVCICVSSKVSATYNAAVNARDSFAGRDIQVVDSLNMSMGQGFMVLAAAEAAQQGATAAEVAARAVDVGKRVHVYAVLATLKYLALSGRVGKIAAGMADTLNIKPILTVRDGKLELLERIRTRKKALERLLELTDQALNGKGIERAALIHVNNLEGANQLRQQFCERHACPGEMITAEFTPGLSVHGGSGVVGLVVVEE